MGDVSDSLTLLRQMKVSIRGSEEYLLVGIDVAKQKHHAFFGTPNGKTLRKNLVFDNSLAGFESLRDLAEDLQAQHGLQTRASPYFSTNRLVPSWPGLSVSRVFICRLL